MTVKEKLQENGLISGKSDVSLLMLHFQKYKFVDIPLYRYSKFQRIPSHDLQVFGVIKVKTDAHLVQNSNFSLILFSKCSHIFHEDNYEVTKLHICFKALFILAKVNSDSRYLNGIPNLISFNYR